MAGHFIGGLPVVDADRGKIGRRPAGCDRHRRDPGSAQRLDHVIMVAQRRWQDHAIDAPALQMRHDVSDCGFLVPFFHHQVDAAAAGLIQAADQKFAKIGGGGVGIEKKRYAQALFLKNCAAPEKAHLMLAQLEASNPALPMVALELARMNITEAYVPLTELAAQLPEGLPKLMVELAAQQLE